jgi:hypothetical protein
VRGSLLMVWAALSLLALLVFATDGSAGLPQVAIALTASGPSPGTMSKRPMDELEFVNQDSVAHTVVFASGRPCSLNVPPGATGECHDGGPTGVGVHSYTVDGKFPGTVNVLAYHRSVSLTARSHTIRLGGRLKLHGQITQESQGSRYCAEFFLLRVLIRHNHRSPYRRLTTLRLGKPDSVPSKHGRCLFGWRLTVRPGRPTTYIAEVTSMADEDWFTRATSHPFTVAIRP